MANEEGSMTSGLLDTGVLSGQLKNMHTPDELRGALEGVLMPAVGNQLCAKYAALLVDEGMYTSSAAVADLDVAALEELKVPVGHRKVILRAVFGGSLPIAALSPGAQTATHAPVPVPAAPAPQPGVREFRREWPTAADGDGLMSAADLKQFGLALRGHLRELGKEQLATQMWGRFTNPQDAIPVGYDHAGADDAMLARVLLSAGKLGMPPAVALICETHIASEQGMRALQCLCRRVLLTTEEAGRRLKDLVRSPDPEKDPAKVAARLSAWDAAVVEAEAKGYSFDQHDRRTALYQIVEGCSEFDAVCAALRQSVPGGYPSVDNIRNALGERAADLERIKSGEWVEVSRGGGKSKSAKRRAKRAAKAARAEGDHAPEQAVGMTKQDIRAMMSEVLGQKSGGVPDSQKPCRLFAAGDCKFGSVCKFSHEDQSGGGKLPRPRNVSKGVPADKRERFMGMMAAMYDGGSFIERVVCAVRVVLQSSKRRTRNKQRLSAAVSGCCVGAKRAEGVWSGRVSDLPVADGGADEHFIGRDLMGEVTGVRKADPVVVGTAGGEVVATERADLPAAEGLLEDAVILDTSDETLCSVGKVCEQRQWGFNVRPGNRSACFYEPGGGVVKELVKDGRRFRIPLLGDCHDELAAHGAVQSRVPSWYRDHAVKGHKYRPDCEHCVRAQQRERSARRVKGARQPDPAGGYTLCADFTGKHEPTVDGETVALVACVFGYGDEPDEAEAAYGFVALLESRTAKATARALDLFDAELTRLGRDKSRAIVRFHTDVDRSFLGEVERMAIRKGWRQTDTGGYRSQANSIAERRIGMLKEVARAELLSATGGGRYYAQLWGHALVRANFVLNVNDWSSRVSPYRQLTGREYKWGQEDHCFGEYCTWGVPRVSRGGEYQPAAEQGIWVRKDLTESGGSSHAHVVVPIQWDEREGAWLLGRSVVATSVRVHAGVFPLRMRLSDGGDPEVMSDFVEAVLDPLLESQWLLEAEDSKGLDDGCAVGDSKHNNNGRNGGGLDEVGAADGCGTGEEVVDTENSVCDDSAVVADDVDDEFEVEKVLNMKYEPDGSKLYLVKWVGYDQRHNSWEPEGAMNCPKLVKEFEKGNRKSKRSYAKSAREIRRLREEQCECADNGEARETKERVGMAACAGGAGSGDEDHDSLMAVAELMRRQGIVGDPQEWLPGYKAELSKVTELRLQALTPEEQAEAKRKHLVVKLRMLLEAKRDGRKKARLILQGFREPYSWEQGKSSFAPVAYMTTVRMMVFMAGLSRLLGDQRHVLSVVDISAAFLQAFEYPEGDRPRYVSYRAWLGAAENVFRLKGPLYGQRSAPRRWYETIAGWLVGSMGMEQSENEPCLFRCHTTGVLVCLYVDDLLVRGTREASERFHEELRDRFDCREAPTYLSEGQPLEFLGFRVTMCEGDVDTEVYIDQERAVGTFLEGLSIGGIKPRDCPMPTLVKLFSDPTPVDELQARECRHVIGVLNFLAKVVRFDIAHATSMLSTQMSKPTVGTVRAIKHMLGYLQATAGFRLGGVCGSVDKFGFYSDSDHASMKPHSTRSHTGALLVLNGVPVAWLSKRQPVTAVSPAEAEVYALRDAVLAARLVQWVAEDMGVSVRWPFTMYTDSGQARSFQHDTCPTSKMRGCFQLRDMWVRELRDSGTVIAKHIPRNLNVADLLTHCLSRCKFKEGLKRIQNLRQYFCRGACVNKSIFTVVLS